MCNPPWFITHRLDSCRHRPPGGARGRAAPSSAMRMRCRVAKQLATLQWHQLRLRYVFAICITNKKFLLVHNVQYFHWFTFCLCLSNRSKYQINQKLKLGLLRCAICITNKKKSFLSTICNIFIYRIFLRFTFCFHLSNQSKSLNQFNKRRSFILFFEWIVLSTAPSIFYTGFLWNIHNKKYKKWSNISWKYKVQWNEMTKQSYYFSLWKLLLLSQYKLQIQWFKRQAEVFALKVCH